MSLRFSKKIGSALTLLNAVTDKINAADLANVSILTFYVVGSAGVASGAVQAEDCHDPEAAYAGTWAAEGSPVTITASAVKKITIANDSFFSARIRISTAIGSGTVDVWAIGRG